MHARAMEVVRRDGQLEALCWCVSSDGVCLDRALRTDRRRERSPDALGRGHGG
jgi:hypothetical protein